MVRIYYFKAEQFDIYSTLVFLWRTQHPTDRAKEVIDLPPLCKSQVTPA